MNFPPRLPGLFATNVSEITPIFLKIIIQTKSVDDKFTQPCKAAGPPPYGHKYAGKICIFFHARQRLPGIKGVRRRSETIRHQTLFFVGPPQI